MFFTISITNRLRDGSRKIFRLLWFLNSPEICSLFLGVKEVNALILAFKDTKIWWKKIQVNQRYYKKDEKDVILNQSKYYVKQKCFNQTIIMTTHLTKRSKWTNHLK